MTTCQKCAFLKTDDFIPQSNLPRQITARKQIYQPVIIRVISNNYHKADFYRLVQALYFSILFETVIKREPREVPMLPKLRGILESRWGKRDPEMQWVFWHTYWDRKGRTWKKAAYKDRKKIMATLCRKANVKYFRFHALRHLTASILDDLGVPIGVIQRILGHKNRRTTEIYLHTIGDSERMGMAKLETVPLFQTDFTSDATVPTNMPSSFWQRKVERPSYETLRSDIDQLGYTGTGRKYGVSDNAVRKWMKLYDSREAIKNSNMGSTREESLTQILTQQIQRG